MMVRVGEWFLEKLALETFSEQKGIYWHIGLVHQLGLAICSTGQTDKRKDHTELEESMGDLLKFNVERTVGGWGLNWIQLGLGASFMTLRIILLPRVG